MGPPAVSKLAAWLKGTARRQRERLFPDRATREYRRWRAAHLAERAKKYTNALEPGLLSIVTAVWDGSPLSYFQQLAKSISQQIQDSRAQWIIVANGCKRADLLAYLAQLEEEPFVTVIFSSENTGITGGLRLALEGARGKYVLPVDADDQLHRDALRIVTAHIQKNGYPALLYTDEDKMSGRGVYQPYFKPDWDPVLLANSAYIAHLGVINRELALNLAAYTDKKTEGSPDWDLFIRFANAGYRGVHIPQVVYSWRIHAQSTADDAAAKPYIRSSQQAVIRRFLSAQPASDNFGIQPSPLFGPDAAHFRIVPRRTQPEAIQFVNNARNLDAFSQLTDVPFVAIIGEGLEVANAEWLSDAMAMFDLFDDTVMVGGRISRGDVVTDGPRVFGFGGAFGCPDAGRKLSDPGYFGQLWKQRSVSAVSGRLSVVRTAVLRKVLGKLPPEATLENLGCWIGAEAFEDGGRIIYNPFLHAIEQSGAARSSNIPEEKAFVKRYAKVLPDRRYYPEPLSLTRAYRIDR